MNKEDRLIETINVLIEKNNLRDEIILQERKTHYYIWLRRIGKFRRHIWICAIKETNELGWDYGVVWGEYPAWEDYPKGVEGFQGFDSRTFGTLDFIERFFISWMVDLQSYESVLSAKEEFERNNKLL
jgi:hypothetical protein